MYDESNMNHLINFFFNFFSDNFCSSLKPSSVSLSAFRVLEIFLSGFGIRGPLPMPAPDSPQPKRKGRKYQRNEWFSSHPPPSPPPKKRSFVFSSEMNEKQPNETTALQVLLNITLKNLFKYTFLQPPE